MNGRGYDDGIYFGVALRLVHGVIPYRDFPFVHPPGIGLLMAPIAALSDLVGTRDGFAMARVMTALVAGANAGLAALVVRHRGALTMFVAGTGLAVFPLAVSADSTLFLEPFLVFFCLVGLTLMFSNGQIASRRRLFLAGLALGFAAAVKVWGLLIVAAALIIVLRRWRDALGRLALGAVLGFGVPVLPFFLAAPHLFVHDVVTAQFGRAVTTSSGLHYSTAFRIWETLGLAGLTVLHLSPAVASEFAVVSGIVLTAAALLVYGSSWRSMASADWAILLMAAAAVGAMFAATEYYDYYSYFTASFLAMLLAVCASQLWRTMSVAVARRQVRVVRRGAVAAPVVLTLFLLPQQASYARTYLGAAHDFPPAAAHAIPPGSCVLYDEPAYGITANRFTASDPRCPLPLDQFYFWLSDPLSVSHPSAVVRQVLVRGDYLMLMPWVVNLLSFMHGMTPQMTGWFRLNYTRIYSSSWLVMYRHTGTEPPPRVLPRTSVPAAAKSVQLVHDGLAAEGAARIPQAFTDYQAAARLDPANVYAPFELGTIYQQEDNDNRAVAEYQNALAIDPTFALGWYNLGVLETTRDPSKAISSYKMDLRIRPNDPSGNFNLGVLLIEHREVAQGYRYLDKALSLKPSLRSDIPTKSGTAGHCQDCP